MSVDDDHDAADVSRNTDLLKWIAFSVIVLAWGTFCALVLIAAAYAIFTFGPSS